MTSRRRYRAWCVSACLPGLLAWQALTHAADAPAVPAVPAAPVGYQDHYIDDGRLAPDLVPGDAPTAAHSGGLARSLRVDGVVSLLSADTGSYHSNVDEHGVVLNSSWDTMQYGTWTLDAAGRTGGSRQYTDGHEVGGMFALRQRGMPFDGAWRADNSLGHINTTQVSLARTQLRFYLPTMPIQGMATEWNGPSGWQLSASGGQPGAYGGLVVPNFRTYGGRAYSLGAQWSPAPRWSIGTQWVDARDVEPGASRLLAGSSPLSTHTGMLSVRENSPLWQGQLTAIGGSTDGLAAGKGAWFDASLPRGAQQHSFGAFHIDPNLSWGSQLIASDVQGGYYRYALQRPRLLVDVGLDAVRSVSGRGGSTTYLTGNARYQLSRAWGIGGVSNVSRTNGDTAYRLQGYVDRVNDWGTATTQASVSHDARSELQALTLSQNWNMPAGTHLSTAFTAEHARFDPAAGLGSGGTVISAALAGGGQITQRWSFDGNLRVARTVAGRGAPALSSNMSVSWLAADNWTVLLSFFESRIGSWRALDVTSPLTAPGESLVPSIEDRGLFLTIRWQQSHGLHFAPLGGAPGAASGALAGYIFLDANENGRMDAEEVGADHILVVLDGKYSVETDAKGRYEFAAVAAGRHSIQVVMDNLPLPWTFANLGAQGVEVRTRGRTLLDVAATRMR